MNGRGSEAFERYQRALDIEQSLLRADPLNIDAQRAVSVTYSDLGWLYDRNGDSSASLANYGKSYEIRKALADADPTNMDMQKLLALTLGKMGWMAFRQNDWTGSEKYYGQTLSLVEAIAQHDPENLDARFNVCAAYHQLGQVQRAAGQFDNSLQSEQKAKTMIRSLVEKNSANRVYRLNVGLIDGDIGETFLESALHSQSKTTGARCRALERAESNLQSGIQWLNLMNSQGQLLKEEVADGLEHFQTRLRENQEQLAALRLAGSCSAAAEQQPGFE